MENFLLKTINGNTLEMRQTLTGYSVEVNGNQIEFFDYNESRCEARAEACHYAAMKTLENLK